VKRESALIRKSIKGPPSRVTAGGYAILTLIQKRTGLLPFNKVDGHPHSRFFDYNFSGVRPINDLSHPGQALEVADPRFIAFDDAARMVLLDEQLDPELHERVLAEALAAAAEQGIRGGATTPFLLDRFHRRTGGATLTANVALVRRNAALAAQIARAAAG